MGSLIDVGGQSWMLVTLSGLLGLEALSLQKPPSPLWFSTCGYQVSFHLGGGARWGVITHACEGKASEGNEVWRMLGAGGPTFYCDTDPTAPLSAVAHAHPTPPHTHTHTPLQPTLVLGQSDGLHWGAIYGAPTPVAPAKQAPRAASRHFITLHQIKSNKLITNDCGHASSKYRINIIDLILSMLSEKLINAGAKITALFSRAAATIGWIKRSHEVHST